MKQVYLERVEDIAFEAGTKTVVTSWVPDGKVRNIKQISCFNSGLLTGDKVTINIMKSGVAYVLDVIAAYADGIVLAWTGDIFIGEQAFMEVIFHNVVIDGKMNVSCFGTEANIDALTGSTY